MPSNTNDNFEKAFKQLNKAQAAGVDQIEGPVMVIAGPGTGKTQLLGVRIGNILKQTDTKAHEILCLTFTDAGVTAMRKRLLKFMGPDAYKVNIYTYHAFCNDIINDNKEYFGNFRELSAIDDLEKVELIKSIIDEWPQDHPMARLSGDDYYERNPLSKLFDIMKKEAWTVEYIEAEILKHLKKAEEDGKFDAGKNYTEKSSGITYQKGDLVVSKKEKEIEKYKKVVIAAKEFENYQNKLSKAGRFDYQDMILWVIKAFQNNPDLLSEYQERFQYILVDEYQDTNGTQNNLIFQLADFWENPNLFIVGDEDQAIYRFQGADLGNLMAFKEKYKPVEIVMENNYRSSQKILDASKALIDRNKDRLSVKTLVESRADKNLQQSPILLAYFNPYHEEKGVIDKIVALKEKGVKLSEIAIMATKHSVFDNYLKYFKHLGIPVNVKRPLDILTFAEIQNLLDWLRYIHAEQKKPYSGEHYLFSLMHLEYFGIDPKDIAKISVHCSKRNVDKEQPHWRDVIADESILRSIKLNNLDVVIQFSTMMESLMSDINNATIQVFFQRLLTKGKVIETIMQSHDRKMRLQAVTCFFDFIKAESVKTQYLSLERVLEIIDEMGKNNLRLDMREVLYAEEGVHLMTAHGSKGLEYEYVFIVSCQKNNWAIRRQSGTYSLPPDLSDIVNASDIEDKRRLFYVAMTRAKNYLYISYYRYRKDEKEDTVTPFAHELGLGDDPFIEVNLSDDQLLPYTSYMLQDEIIAVDLIDKSLVEQALTNYSMSVTHLNKYLRCPLSFYFENIVRVPMARSKKNGFGNAIHYALEMIIKAVDPKEEYDEKLKGLLLFHFEKGMDLYHSHFTKKEKSDLTVHGKKILESYFDEHARSWFNAKQLHAEYSIREVSYEGIPINGKIDTVMEYPSGITVIDYKTGNYKKDKHLPPIGEELGGDNWRQLVFYKLLIEADPRQNWKLQKSAMEYLDDKNKGEFREESHDIADIDVQLITEQMKSAYQGIMNHEFERGCGNERCTWCQFVKNNYELEDAEGYAEDGDND